MIMASVCGNDSSNTINGRGNNEPNLIGEENRVTPNNGKAHTNNNMVTPTKKKGRVNTDVRNDATIVPNKPPGIEETNLYQGGKAAAVLSQEDS